jgi:hypothetical protein
MKTVQLTSTIRVPDEVADQMVTNSMEVSFPVFLPDSWTYKVTGKMTVKILNGDWDDASNGQR